MAICLKVRLLLATIALCSLERHAASFTFVYRSRLVPSFAEKRYLVKFLAGKRCKNAVLAMETGAVVTSYFVIKKSLNRVM